MRHVKQIWKSTLENFQFYIVHPFLHILQACWQCFGQTLAYLSWSLKIVSSVGSKKRADHKHDSMFSQSADVAAAFEGPAPFSLSRPWKSTLENFQFYIVHPFLHILQACWQCFGQTLAYLSWSLKIVSSVGSKKRADHKHVYIFVFSASALTLGSPAGVGADLT